MQQHSKRKFHKRLNIIQNVSRVMETPKDPSIKEKLSSIFRKFYSQSLLAERPEVFSQRIKKDGKLWYELLFSFITNNDQETTIMLNNLTQASETIANRLSQTDEPLSNQFWDKNLWVLLCENISEIIKCESQYERIIEIILLKALDEKFIRDKRVAKIDSLFSDNPWYTVCKSIIPLLTDEHQKYKIIFLCLALSGQQKKHISDFLMKKEMRNYLLTLLTMTHKRWMNLFQITNLLKRKRELLRTLPYAPTSVKLEDKDSVQGTGIDAVNIAKHNQEDTDAAEDIKIKQDANIVICEPENEDIKIEQEAGTLSPHFKVKESNKNASEPIKSKHTIKMKHQEVIKLPTVTGQIKVALVGFNTLEHTKLEEVASINADTTSITENKPELNTVVSKHDEVKQAEDTNNLASYELKNKKVENEDNEQEENYLVPEPTEDKIEQLCQNISLIANKASQQTEKEEILKKKELLALDKIILNFSLQQLSKHSAVIINEDSIYKSDDEDDCIMQEIKKLDVPQLLNMYHEIVLEEPSKVIKNSLADQNNDQVLGEKIPKLNNAISQKHGSSTTILERSSSTSSNTSKSSKLGGPMSAAKKKMENQNNKTRRKSKNVAVKKLFERLRNESLNRNSAENSVVVLDDTLTPKKHKMSPDTESTKSKKAKFSNEPNSDCIVVPTEIEGSSTVTPKKTSTVHCSTPIINKNNNYLNFKQITSKNSKPKNNSTAAQNLTDEITDLTKEINNDSYLTIDLTTESLNCSSISKAQNTVIDLDKTVNDQDCTVVSVENDNLSISGESDVTVLNMSQAKKERQVRKLFKALAELDAAKKVKFLELITDNNQTNDPPTRAIGVEDTYIKEVILGQSASRNSIGSNIYNPNKDIKNKTGLRMIVIDGSNVAMEHGRGKYFSVKGLKICIDYFLKRGHVVKAFVPRFRDRAGKSSDPELLKRLERSGHVVFTPSREIQGRMITSYDDRYIVQCAAEFDGVIVSGDNYRDLLFENPRWRFVIENRLLMFTWVEDMIMFPRDPLGRNGPTLEQFLRHPNPAPATSSSFFVGG